jgi:hypothetical protein
MLAAESDITRAVIPDSGDEDTLMSVSDCVGLY